MKNPKNGAMRDCLFCSQLEAQCLELFRAQSEHSVAEPMVKAACSVFYDTCGELQVYGAHSVHSISVCGQI